MVKANELRIGNKLLCGIQKITKAATLADNLLNNK